VVAVWVARSVPILLAFVAPLGSTVALAEESPSTSVGDSNAAMPGIERVGVPAPVPQGLSAAASGGYGYTEPQSSKDGAHHRLMGSVAVAVSPISALSLGLKFDGRYDHHPDDGMGSHGGEVGDPRFLARFTGAVAPNVRLGAELDAWFPGKDAPSLALDATTLDAKILAGFALGRPTLAAIAGFRWDNSQHAVSAPDRLRFGDRLALGLSDFNAALVGIGISVPISKTEILGEVSGDLLLGSGAPKITDSPLRATAGVRHSLSRAFAVEFLAEASLSGRPAIGPNTPLVPIEPRASVLLGLRYALPFERETAPTSAPPPEVVPVTPEPAKPATKAAVAVVVHVVGKDGAAIANAAVELRIGDAALSANTGADGTSRFENPPPGDGTIAISADGFSPGTAPVHVGAEPLSPIDVTLDAAPPSGQLRGLVRSFAGKGLSAKVSVDPSGTETKTDPSGAFTLDVPPGDYQVTIHADHYKDQKRKIHVDQNGVTVLNAELFEAK
jgi:hypothetical protein